METQKVDFHSDTESEIDRGEVRGNIVWKGNQYPIFEGENIIGREDDCDVTIEHDSVSLKHAVLDYENGVAIMRDLKSKNGTSLESSAGSGQYIKLGPTRRNEPVGSGCKIRFGLVDCKYIAVSIESSTVVAQSAGKKDLKYDCETQFINMAAPDSDEENENNEEANLSGILNKSTSSNSAYDHSYDRPPSGNNPFSASFNRGSSAGSTVLEMETQLDQDLNSAEKAQVHSSHSSNTPSSIFSSRLVQGIAGGVESPAANSGMSTPSAIPQRTAGTGDSTGNSTNNSSRSATPLALPLARDDTPATAVGDDDCSTEDDGLNDLDDENHRHHEHVPIEIPIPAFHPVGIADESLSDGSDDESDMSQDLMRAEDDEDVENEPQPATITAPDAPVMTTTPAPTPQKASAPQEDVPTDDEADEVDENASVDFNLAQDEPHGDTTCDRAVSRAPSLTASTNAPISSDSPFHNMASADSRLSAPMEMANEDTNHSRPSVASNGHGLINPSRSNSIVLEANTEPQEFFTAPDPPTAPSVFANASPEFSSSPTISGSERERARDLHTAVRSPGAAIRDLLKNSTIPEGVKVFRSQGGLVDSDDESASPAMSSIVSSSLPPDAPPMNFDFGALTKNGGSSSAAATTPASTPAAQKKDTEDEEVEEEAVVVKQGKPNATAARGRKRIFDEESDEEFNEPLPPRAANKSSSSSSEPAPAIIPEPLAAAPKSAVKRVRTNSRAPTPVFAESAVESVAEVPVVVEAPSTAKKGAARGRKTPSPAPVVEEPSKHEEAGETGETEEAPSTGKKAPAKRGRGKAAHNAENLSLAETETPPTQDVIEVLMQMKAPEPEPTPAKRGRGKAAPGTTVPAEPSSDETVPQVVEVAPGFIVEATPAPKTAAKRGRGKTAVEETPMEVQTEPEAPVAMVVVPEVPVPVAKTPAKRGRGKVTISDSTPEQHSAPAEHQSDSRVGTPVPVIVVPKKGRGKAAVVEAPLQEEVAVPESEVELPAAAEPPTKKGRGKNAAPKEDKVLLEEPAVVEAVTDEAPAPPSKAAKKGTKRGAAASAEDTTEAAVAPAQTADQEVRILFTKVDEAPYLKAIKNFPNASVTSDATMATHCVTLPELKRTPKLMVALNCGVKYVVTEQWIKDCVKAKTLVEVVKPADAAPAKKAKKSSAVVVDDDRADPELVKQLQASPYIVQDAEKEKLWGFSMTTTLAIPRHTDAVKLFDKMCFFCTKGVCGETAPPADELSTIIQSGGGVWLNSLEEWGEYGGGKAKTKADRDMHSLVVISHANVVKKEVNKKVMDAISKGEPSTSGVYSIELVFQACLKQRVEFEAHQLK